ncbi:transient receptor potential cation channel subfamily M member 2 [Neolamprologus brichardi]|uniref:transient receptor potential cation channel subfamily M member 2 n=1 Tax=Neolamprologus brichardi TaxID=32507 RepID=UPI001643C029|nr:transient receptor potential cation channel subfamily M member 2 [Neolamprologus brichardi]
MMSETVDMLPKFESKVHPQQVTQQLQQQKTHGINQARVSASYKRLALASWIKENICKKECCFFEKDGSGDVCKCGYAKTDHTDEAIKPEDFTGESWNIHRHVREAPTDAFGDISFGGLGQKTGKYARVSTDTSPEILYQLLTEQWKLSPPNLLISVTGGAKNFYLKSHLKNMFHRGLIKVAQTTGTGVTIPVVCVVLDGGPGTLNTIYNAMQHGTPCVILEGSGRIADVIAHVSGLPLIRVTIALIQQLMKKFFGQEYEQFSDGKIIEWTKKIQDIIRMSHLLTVFRVSEDYHGDLDVAILQALLKASRSSEFLEVECWNRQLELAITWDRVDIAETEIFTEESQWKSNDLHWAMFSALTGNKPQFVSLLLENGVNLRDFLQEEETLCELYAQLPSCFFLRKLAKRIHSARCSGRQAFDREQGKKKISLTYVSDEVRHLLGKFTQPLYPPSTTTDQLNMSMDETSLSPSKSQTSSQAQLREDSPETQRDPGTDLFLWAVVQNNKELAEIAWEQCRDCMSAALAASKILKKMAREGSDADDTEEMRELANHYEKHAIGVFTECHNSDESRAKKLLVRMSHLWGRTTCLRLALEADDKNVIAQSGVQALLTQIWCGKLSVENPVWRVLICMVFFPLIYTGFLCFRHDEIIQRETAKDEEMKTVENLTGSTLRRNGYGPLKPMKHLGCWSRLMYLYTSPQVKFYWNIVFYFAFLFLFAVVLMIDFQKTPSAGELLLYIWLLSLVCEEVRQLFHDPDGFGFRKKAKMYINEFWNILDVLSIVLFLIGLAFRLTTELFYLGKIILCIDFVVFCLRLMAIFTISRTLGPKIIIVRKMMMDMFFFMFLLSIWVVAYGVAKQGILIHNENRLDWIIRGVLYEPYLIIFGQFPKNIDNTEFDMNSCSVNATDPLKPKCPVLNENQSPVFPEWLTIIMLCVYLLFANILLLNLLIAIFNFTFEEVQDNTDKIWKFQRYELIKEYHSRPAAPPPFIIFSHIYLFIRSMVLRRPPKIYKEFKNELNPTEDEELLTWESLMKDRYLVSARQEQSQSTERRILDTAQKVNIITDLLERNGETSAAAMLKRLTQLEEQVSQSTKALQLIMDSLKPQGVPSKDTQSRTPAVVDETPDSFRNASEKGSGFHVNSRQFSYPNSKLTRFPVPEEKVPWEVSFSSYKPTNYTSDDSKDHVDGSEPEALANYRNPGGRTGISGRGALSCLGPNLSVELVITRWRDSEKSVLEYLAVCDESRRTLALPAGPVDSADKLPPTLKKTMGKKLCETINAKLSEGTKVFEGYVDDCRNTDNAWVEMTVLNIHLDRKSQVMVDINNTVLSSNGALQWQEVSSKATLGSNQRESLRLAAALHNRKF